MKSLNCLFVAMLLGLAAGPATAFDISFTWDGLKSCTNGKPNRVSNPRFELKDVPAGTKFISFKLKDLDVPGFNHGGGTIAYSGQKVVDAGAFKYKSPCPPDGVHVYQWEAVAKKKKMGGKLAKATARRKYPE